VKSEGGVILQDLHEYVGELGYQMPIDLGARGSCQIGGNLATNAGGIHYIRHNSMHANCIGLKAVLPSGEILDNMTTLRKDNTGYDLKHLFIGSEGTLGIITECAILCSPTPKSKELCVVACKSFEDVVEVLKHAKKELSASLHGYELMDHVCMEMAVTHGKVQEIFD